MDLFFALAIMVLGWIFLIFSWYIDDVWGAGLLAVTSMLFFFASGTMMLYITEPYVYITSLDVVGTGEMHLSMYQPYSLLFYVFGMITMVWLFIMVFFDVVIPKLREMGAK